MEQIKLIIDNRERNINILKILEQTEASIEFQNLPVGDYILSDRICIERKTIRDFETSIIDGRLFDQINRIKDYYESPILLIEGEEEYKLNRNVIEGTLIAIYTDYNIPIIFSKNPEDTSRILYMIAKREQINKKREPSQKGKNRMYTNEDFQISIIGNLPGIGTKLAKQLLEHFGNIKNIANANIEDLTKVEKIGKKKANHIFNIINSTYSYKNNENAQKD
ncbi:MAG: ERCC4 domain-containing protein [Candidatus Micrarchaeia archaeon]